MIREYIFDHRFSLTLKNNTLDIVNYLEIISFSDDAITLKYEGGNIALILTKEKVNQMDIYDKLSDKKVYLNCNPFNKIEVDVALKNILK